MKKRLINHNIAVPADQQATIISQPGKSLRTITLDRLIGTSYEGFQVPDPIKFAFDRNGNIEATLEEDETVISDYIYYANTNRLEQVTGLYPGDSNFEY